MGIKARAQRVSGWIIFGLVVFIGIVVISTMRHAGNNASPAVPALTATATPSVASAAGQPPGTKSQSAPAKPKQDDCGDDPRNPSAHGLAVSIHRSGPDSYKLEITSTDGNRHRYEIKANKDDKPVVNTVGRGETKTEFISKGPDSTTRFVITVDRSETPITAEIKNC